jgi:endonuclease YncB( thermonuclease family)
MERINFFRPDYVLVSFITLIIAYIIRKIYTKNIRIRTTTDLPRNYLNLQITGIVTSVSDGDGFKLFHTPFLRSSQHKSSDQKLNIRLAGIDAPETRYFNTPQQPFAAEAKEFLGRLLLNKTVRIKILGIDRYNRILAVVFLGGFCNRVNVNLRLIEEGYACVYIGRDGVYGEYKEKMIDVQKEAQKKKKGMWSLSNVVLPMDHKKAFKNKKKAIK